MTRSCILAFLISASLSAQQPIDGFHYTTTKTATYSHAAVSSAHPLASLAGMQIMKNGGNAFDGAVATQLVLAVVYPAAGNLGGGGLLMARKADGQMIALEYRERAPGKATNDMYLDSSGEVVPDLSTVGHLAAGVPGTVAGLFATLSYCKLSFSTLAKPAIALATEGFAVTRREAASLNEHRDEFLQHNDSAIPFVKAVNWKEGDTLKQPELAAVLRRLVKFGAKDFYQGQTAKFITAEMTRGKGLISLSDLASYQAKKRIPIQFGYRGYTVFSFPPPSSGGLLLGQMLKMTEPYPIAQYGFQSPQAVHLMTEIERRAYADRAEHMGDPDFYPVPQKILLGKKYLLHRMQDYDSSRAGSSDSVKAGMIPESHQTTHLSVADSLGNCVSVTTTLNDSYGCKTVVRGAGFFLNNEMDDFSTKPGVPNMYGAIGGRANAIEPGKRMLSSMTPTLVMKDRQPFLVLGTPGGTTIPTSVYQTIVNVIDFNMSIEDAVNKPKFHHQWLPDEVNIESGFDAATADSLQKMGYLIKPVASLGRMEVIQFDNKTMSVCADSRGDDSADGF